MAERRQPASDALSDYQLRGLQRRGDLSVVALLKHPSADSGGLLVGQAAEQFQQPAVASRQGLDSLELFIFEADRIAYPDSPPGAGSTRPRRRLLANVLWAIVGGQPAAVASTAR